jgi:hypothetical protein
MKWSRYQLAPGLFCCQEHTGMTNLKFAGRFAIFAVLSVFARTLKSPLFKFKFHAKSLSTAKVANRNIPTDS